MAEEHLKLDSDTLQVTNIQIRQIKRADLDAERTNLQGEITRANANIAKIDAKLAILDA